MINYYFQLGKPAPKLELVSAAIKEFSNIILEERDIETMVDALWGLSFLTESYEVVTAELLSLPNFVSHILSHFPIPRYIQPAIRLFGNFVTGAESSVDVCITDLSSQ